MKFTTTTILAAALATVSSAAAVPSATALQPLPGKFTLVFTSSGTALDKFSHDITIDIAFGGMFATFCHPPFFSFEITDFLHRRPIYGSKHQ